VDHEEMLPMVDLWSYDEVRERAESILERLETGDMPCDGRWSEEWVERLSQWMAEGMPE
jgi:hypothetical protein